MQAAWETTRLRPSSKPRERLAWTPGRLGLAFSRRTGPWRFETAPCVSCSVEAVGYVSRLGAQKAPVLVTAFPPPHGTLTPWDGSGLTY